MNADAGHAPLIVFCGKGGVGKTTLSLAYALLRASLGMKVVVVTSHPLKELALTVSLRGLKEEKPETASNLFVVHIDPREILNSRVRQQIPSEFIASRVLSSRVYQNLVEVAPGVKELAFLARLRQLAQKRRSNGAGSDFDLLVWDAPATGHLLQTLRVSKDFKTYMSGPFALMGQEIIQFYSNPRNIHFLLVTILEEMAVQETLELHEVLAHELNIQPAGLICNLTSPLMAKDERIYQELCREVMAGDISTEEHKFVLGRHAAERTLFSRLTVGIPASLYIVERLAGFGSDLDLLWSLAGSLRAVCVESGR